MCPFGSGFIRVVPWLFPMSPLGLVLCFLHICSSVGFGFLLAEAVSSICFLLQSLGTPLPLALVLLAQCFLG